MNALIKYAFIQKQSMEEKGMQYISSELNVFSVAKGKKIVYMAVNWHIVQPVCSCVHPSLM